MLREEKYKQQLLKKVQKILKAKGLDSTAITREVYINHKGERGYVDIVIETDKKLIPIEVKHDDSRWSKEEIAYQVKKYDGYYKNNRKAKKTVLLSPAGRYGMDEQTFLNKLEAWL